MNFRKTYRKKKNIKFSKGENSHSSFFPFESIKFFGFYTQNHRKNFNPKVIQNKNRRKQHRSANHEMCTRKTNRTELGSSRLEAKKKTRSSPFESGWPSVRNRRYEKC